MSECRYNNRFNLVSRNTYMFCGDTEYGGTGSVSSKEDLRVSFCLLFRHPNNYNYLENKSIL